MTHNISVLCYGLEVSHTVPSSCKNDWEIQCKSVLGRKRECVGHLANLGCMPIGASQKFQALCFIHDSSVCFKPSFSQAGPLS